jgi:hypothetical protein
VLARRQLDEQRRFLNEQDEIGRHQVRVTEQSLSEQNERARLSLAFDLIMRLRDCFDSPGFLRSRREAAKFLLDNAFVEDAAEAPSLATNSAAMTVCNLLAAVRARHREDAPGVGKPDALRGARTA